MLQEARCIRQASCLEIRTGLTLFDRSFEPHFLLHQFGQQEPDKLTDFYRGVWCKYATIVLMVIASSLHGRLLRYIYLVTHILVAASFLTKSIMLCFIDAFVIHLHLAGDTALVGRLVTPHFQGPKHQHNQESEHRAQSTHGSQHATQGTQLRAHTSQSAHGSQYV